ncbi:LodA/GoxA family CTQ-dependent oxidase [Marinomonas algicola]|uniref:LodA/GoxA family CTQ-dependent oxidase n=1 Tax=Marinomonas algicola TaxID=2773454 RepID=UPI00174B1BCF|nr:LodA/GoxA family CTQ-dependent oxidase [Marinomonas algicola]
MDKTTKCNEQDSRIVRAAIHPGIGVSRVGNAETEFYIGPEVTAPLNKSHDFYRTPQGALKRQAARFRLYGYNAAGEVVRELTHENATLSWTVQVANRKANWFHFITAMDIPESKDLVVKRRNPLMKSAEEREQLIIAPDAVTVSGLSIHGAEYQFNTGSFKGESVYLGELQTDEKGRLLFLGGHGVSKSPSGKPPYDPADGDSFNNAADWYDDMADGPVNAEVMLDGKAIPVQGSWVISAPPNYAPDAVSWRTMYDLMMDLYVNNGWLPVPETTSFTKDVLPQLQRLSNLQWVNKGFATLFGSGGQMNFNEASFVSKLAAVPESPALDPYDELRRVILNSFRPHQTEMNDPRLWPWLYGDDFGGDLFQESPNTMLALPSLQQLHLQRWAHGEFINDWEPSYKEPDYLDDIPLTEQPDMLDKAAMHFCLADAFHPGCEMTWPMRHPTLYSAPFRIRQSRSNEAPCQWGESLSQKSALAIDGPLYAQVAGGLTRWMGLPWQGDTAYCRAGYDPDFDMYQPSFWPARVPNTILSEDDYKVVMDTNASRATRIAAFNRRLSWNRFIDRPLESDDGKPSIAQVMDRMIAEFAQQGIIEARKGLDDDPDFPSTMYVEKNGYTEHAAARMLKAVTPAAPNSREERIRNSGWASEEQLSDAVRLRQRKPTT